MPTTVRMLLLLLVLGVLLTACACPAEVPETTAPQAAEPERVYPLYYCASGGNSLFLSNTSKVMVYEDNRDPAQMADVFSSQPLGKQERLYLRLSQLQLTEGMEDLTLELHFYRAAVDPEFSFRIWFSWDNGSSWTELTELPAPEPTGERFLGSYPIQRLSVSGIQKRIPEGQALTDLKLEPFSETPGKKSSFRLIRASLSYLALPEAQQWQTEPVSGWFTTNGTKCGTVEGEALTAQGYTTAEDTLVMTASVRVSDRYRSARIRLRVLAPEGAEPTVRGVRYSKDTKTWIRVPDAVAGKLERVFTAEDGTRYDIYEITAPVPREAEAVRRIQWEVSMDNQNQNQTLHVLGTELDYRTQRDDSPMLQKMIDDAKAAGQNEIVIPAVNPATGLPGYQIGTTVWLSSDTTVILDGCYMRFNDGVMCNMFASKGAWAESDDPELMAGQRNIRILGRNGAAFDGGNSNGKTEKTVQNGERMMWNCFVLMRNVDGFEVSGIRAQSSRYWCFTFLYGRNGSIHDIEFDCRNEKPNQDGIDLRQGCHNIDIYNLTGVTGDDTVALTAIGRNDAWHTVKGITDIDIHDVTIRNVRAGCSGGHGVIRLLAQDGKKVYNVAISDVYDGALEGNGKACYGLLRIGDVRYFADTPQAFGDINGITVENVVSAAKAAIYVNNENITSEHITWKNVTAESGEVLKVKDEARFYGN